MTNLNLTSSELAALQEMVWGALESLQTDGDDRADNPTFTFYCNLYAKLGGTPPAAGEDEISPGPRQWGISVADDPIDIPRKGGT